MGGFDTHSSVSIFALATLSPRNFVGRAISLAMDDASHGVSNMRCSSDRTLIH
jgi:hypothetical protein